ncbi:hypothetical protein HU727_025460 [Pseudomonas sp. SWRI153]|uniref:Uncharacterized protein n=1 Tax=Pseudomonas khorasanensis TaxID=2745508 RepID=A0A923F6I0_9PSED|nr:hypothetical protein [Pseudomonas khorasanensis]MBV4488939.1 hypothetical protein [Pseudomonas khorasanensis]
MSTYYTCEPGIKLHEQLEHITDPGFVSFTLVAGTLQDLWPTWKNFSHLIAAEWPVTIKWRTIGYSLEQQKIQEIRLKKEILSNLSPKGFLKKNEKTKIYSYLDPAYTKDISFEPKELTQYRNTMLILKKSEQDLHKIWSELSEYDKTVSVESISKVMTNNRDTFIARFLELDTHSIAQFITPVKNSYEFASILAKLKVTETKVTDLHEIINNS